MPKEVAIPEEPTAAINSLDFLLLTSASKNDFIENTNLFTQEVCKSIEVLTRGQADSLDRFQFRKHVITAPKAHDVKTRLATIKLAGAGEVDLTAILTKISGNTSVKVSIQILLH